MALTGHPPQAKQAEGDQVTGGEGRGGGPSQAREPAPCHLPARLTHISAHPLLPQPSAPAASPRVLKGGRAQLLDPGHSFGKQQASLGRLGCLMPSFCPIAHPLSRRRQPEHHAHTGRTPAADAWPGGLSRAAPPLPPRPPCTPHLVSSGMLLLSSQLSWAWAGSWAPAAGSPESEWSVGAGLGLLLGVKLPRFRELTEAAWCWLGPWACESGGGGVRSREWFCRPPGGSRAQTRQSVVQDDPTGTTWEQLDRPGALANGTGSCINKHVLDRHLLSTCYSTAGDTSTSKVTKILSLLSFHFSRRARDNKRN